MHSRSVLYGLMLAHLMVTPFGMGGTVAAQERITVDGDVKVGRGSAPDTRLEVILMTAVGVEVKRVYTDLEGKFSFFNVDPGEYRIVVKAPYKGRYRDSLAQLRISRTGSTQFVAVTVFLEEETPTPEVGPKTGTIDVGELQASIPRQAKKLYEQGAREAADGRAEEAVALFRRALEIAPDYLFALNDLGAQLLKLDRLDESIQVLRKATALAPRAYLPRVNLGVALLSARRPADARAEIAVALEARPEDANALYVSGQIERALGERERAITAFNGALLQSNGRLVAALIHLGALYEETGQREKAIEVYRTYLDAAADGPSAALARKRLEVLGAPAPPP